MRVIGFDQSLTATGWVVIDFFNRERPVWVEHGTIRTEPKDGVKGFYDTIPRCDSIARAVMAIMKRYVPVGDGEARQIDAVVHEMPALPSNARKETPGTKVFAGRTDASLMTSIAVRTTCHVLDVTMPIVMISANAAKRTLTGLANAEKEEVKDAVFERLGVEPFRINVNVTDAAAAAIAAVERKMVEKAIAELAGTE
jgi:Holliday junction resolvasome RuvABC endonuclease subunit